MTLTHNTKFWYLVEKIYIVGLGYFRIGVVMMSFFYNQTTFIVSKELNKPYLKSPK